MSQETTPFRLIPEEKPSHTTNETGDLQFDQAEFTTPSAAANTCTQCSHTITQSYYALGGNVLCQRCRNQLLAERQAGSPLVRVGKATLGGLLAAIAGSVLYCAVFLLTGYEFGLIAIVVGVLVGSAVKWGAQGRGGWGYQALAVFLTYCAIVTSYVPPMIQGFRQTIAERSQQHETKGSSATPAATSANVQKPPAPTEATRVASTEESQATAQEVEKLAQMSTLQLAMMMLPFAFLAPIFGGFENLIGLVIIGIGLYEAWKLNRREEFAITGPFALNTATPHATTH